MAMYHTYGGWWEEMLRMMIFQECGARILMTMTMGHEVRCFDLTEGALT